jgi:hypothetical protein
MNKELVRNYIFLCPNLEDFNLFRGTEHNDDIPQSEWPISGSIRVGGLISLWLYKENNKLRD